VQVENESVHFPEIIVLFQEMNDLLETIDLNTRVLETGKEKKNQDQSIKMINILPAMNEIECQRKKGLIEEVVLKTGNESETPRRKTRKKTETIKTEEEVEVEQAVVEVVPRSEGSKKVVIVEIEGIAGIAIEGVKKLFFESNIDKDINLLSIQKTSLSTQTYLI
jgi:hypothetical protein